MKFLRNLFSKEHKEEAQAVSDEERAQAKKIFFEYSCNEFNMAREGENFGKYRISDEQKAQWRKEFIAYWTSKLSVDDLEAVIRLSPVEAIESVPDLLDIAKQGDSYAKVMIAGAIRSAGLKYGIDKNLRKQTLDIASTLCESIVEGQIQLSENHRKQILAFHPTILGTLTPEEYVLKVAKSVLSETKK
jgi:hypothetical protein